MESNLQELKQLLSETLSDNTHLKLSEIFCGKDDNNNDNEIPDLITPPDTHRDNNEEDTSKLNEEDKNDPNEEDKNSKKDSFLLPQSYWDYSKKNRIGAMEEDLEDLENNEEEHDNEELEEDL